MFRTDNPTAAASRPAPAAAGTPGYFTDGNPGTATPPTIMTADWANGIQEELMAIILAASLTPSKTTLNQVLAAIRILCWTSLNDGAGSGLDADLFHGQTDTYYTAIAARLGYTPANKAGDNFTGAITRASNTVWDAGNDGSGSGLDADLFRGQAPSAFAQVVAQSLVANNGYRVWSDTFKECWGSVTVPNSGGTLVVNLPYTHTSWFNVNLGVSLKNSSSANFNTGLQSKSGFASFTLQNWENIDLVVDWSTRGV